MKVGVVVPSNRPERLAEWQAAWRDEWEPHGATLYVVRDEQATWDAIRRDIAVDAWIIPRRTDCIRSYGFLQAWRDGCDIIWTVDDDCLPAMPNLPAGQTLREHVEALSRYFPASAEDERWVSTITGLPPRGLPTEFHFPCMVNHGLWLEVPDLAGAIQTRHPGPYVQVGYEYWQPVPMGRYFPMSGMNLAFRREAMPLMWFGLMGDRLNEAALWDGMHRMGDILCGVVMKRIADQLGWAVSSGPPFVRHSRASDPQRNAALEEKATAANEWWWNAVDEVDFFADTPEGCYEELAEAIVLPETDYWRAWRRGATTWLRVLKENA